VGDRFVCAAMKPVAPVLEVDWTTGHATLDARRLIRTGTDAAAFAVAGALAAQLDCELWAVAVAGPAAEQLLGDAIAQGAHRALRVVVDDDDRDAAAPAEQWPSDVAAAALATIAAGAAYVVCGDASGDRGSGTVPSRLAQLLGLPQALGLREVTLDEGHLLGTRRLDGGRREHLSIVGPCVVSVETGVATPSRAPLAAVLRAASKADPVEVRHVALRSGARRGDPVGTVVGSYRARPSDLPAPREHDPVRRAIAVAGSLATGDPPEVLRADPDTAALAILDRLARWGLR